MNKKRICLIFGIIFLGLFVSSISATLVFGIRYKNNRNMLTNQFSNVNEVFLNTDLEDPTIKIAGKIYSPKDHDKYSEALPLVLLQHGMGGIKENYISMALNFVQRGFVVATFDLRRHGDSNGYHTFGIKESDDLVFGINYILNNLNGSIYNISDVGIVGHSMGAITAIMTSYKSGINSCVALSPAAFVSEMLTTITHGNPSSLNTYFGSENPFYDNNFLEDINLLTYLENRINENPYPRTKNLLLCSGLADTTVSSDHVYNLFRTIIKLENPENNTLYGDFQNFNATQCNIYEGAPHSAQYFPWITPSITRDIINWTERALIGESNSIARGLITTESLIMNDFELYDSEIDSSFMLSVLGLTLSALFFTLAKTYGKEKEYFYTLPPKYLVILPKSKKSVGENEKKSIFYDILLITLISASIGLVIKDIYVPGIINSVLPEILIRFLGIFALPIIAWFLYQTLKNFIRNRPYTKMGNLEVIRNNSRFETFIQHYGLANSSSSLGNSIILGSFLGLYPMAGLLLISKWLEKEEFIKPIVFWDKLIITGIIIAVLVMILQLFFYGYFSRMFSIKNKKCRFLSPIITAMFQLILIIPIGTMILIFDPFFSGTIIYGGFTIPLKFGSIAMIVLFIFVLNLFSNIFTEITKSTMFSVSFFSTLLSWIILSVLPVF